MGRGVDEFRTSEQRLSQFFEDQRRQVCTMLERNMKMTWADANDVYQNACIALFENIQSGKLKTLTCSLSSYFWSICLNQARKFLRDSHKALSLSELPDPSEDGFCPTQIDWVLDAPGDEITEEQKKMMHDIVKKLPYPCESILWGYYGDNLSLKELAPLVGYDNVNVVKTRKSQCMSKLRAHFEKLKAAFYD